MTDLWTTYLNTHHILHARPRTTLTLFLAVWLVACGGLLQLELDLSFRPLFTSGATDVGPTDEFESVFGQSSGADAVFIVKHPAILGQPFLDDLARFSKRLGQVAGIVSVTSLTSMRLPEPSQPGDQFALRTRSPNKAEMAASRLLSADGQMTLVLARLEPPLDALAERRDILRRLEIVAFEAAPRGSKLYYTGVSVVEAAYADHILIDQLIATSLTMTMLVILLALLFRSWRAVTVCLMPTAFVVPMSLGVMGWWGEPVTIINSVIPAVILVIGVADAVHMVVAWVRQDHGDSWAALDGMLTETGPACALTTLTTAAGFLALTAARLEVIRGFGIAIACGVILAWFANQVLVPQILARLPFKADLERGFINHVILIWQKSLTQVATVRPWTVVMLTTLLLVPVGWLALHIDSDQRFNEELPAGHPVREAQNLLEQEFGGFLGPDLDVSRRDGGSLLNAESQQRLDRLLNKLGTLQETQYIVSLRDVLPGGLTEEAATAYLDSLRKIPEFSFAVGERINKENNRMALQVRTGDLGTRRAAEYRDAVLNLANETLGHGFSVKLVGQWWLAQQGMRLILGDMLRSLLTALLVVLPVLWLALREWRLFTAAMLANLVPLLVPLAFMAVTGITVRIGTAVVLAIVLGIAVDNTLHVIKRMEAMVCKDLQVIDSVNAMMEGTGRAVIYTTLALIAGFLSMLFNQLLAIQDMGLVAAIAFAAALFADLLLLPAVYFILSHRVPAIAAKLAD